MKMKNDVFLEGKTNIGDKKAFDEFKKKVFNDALFFYKNPGPLINRGSARKARLVSKIAVNASILTEMLENEYRNKGHNFNPAFYSAVFAIFTALISQKDRSVCDYNYPAVMDAKCIQRNMENLKEAELVFGKYFSIAAGECRDRMMTAEDISLLLSECSEKINGRKTDPAMLAFFNDLSPIAEELQTKKSI